jgi:hypothetical protein
MTETPWQRARKTKSQRQEERIGRLPGGSQQVNSGRHWRWKRDNKLHEFLIEARTTDNKTYSISKDEFQKIRTEALKTPPGLLPGMQIDIQGLSLLVMELTAFQDLQARLIDLEARLEGEDENEEGHV